MIRLVITFLILIQGFSPGIQPASTQLMATDNPGATLCLPGIYMTDPLDFLPIGPSSYLTQMASIGIELPLTSIPYHPIDESLGVLPYSYAVLGDGPTPVYASLEEAISGKNAIRSIEPGGLRYVSYIDYSDTDTGRFFKLHDETWVRVSSRVSIPHSYL